MIVIVEIPEDVQDIIQKLTNRILIVEKYTDTIKEFKAMIETHYDYLKQGFEYTELRSCPVHFKFFDTDEDVIHSLQLRHFVINAMLWEMMVRMGTYDRIDATYIIDATKVSSRTIKAYIDNQIIIPFRSEIGNRKLNTTIASSLDQLARIPTDFNIILGLSINMEVFIDMANKNQRFDEILHTKIDENMQPHEVEDYLKELTNEQFNILGTEENLLRPIIRAETGIKKEQYKEFAVNSGMTPDLDGITVPIPINANFIVGGLSNVTNYYLDSTKGRKSAIMNKTQMGRSGYFSRMTMLLSSDVKLSKTVHDCGTLHPIQITIKSAEHLRRLKGRNYRLPAGRTYMNIRGDEKYLIGHDILLRTPITCASKDICKTCYGNLYHTNKDLESVGGFAGTEITNPLSQRILSSKHLLTTQSVPIEFNDAFYDFFTLSANEIQMNSTNDDIDISKYSLILIKDNVQHIDAFDDVEFNSYIELLHIKDNRTGEITEFQELSGKELYITTILNELMKKDRGNKEYYEIDMSKIPDDEGIFAVEISNNELTKPLYSIMDLMNKATHENCSTVDEMAQRMLDLLIESGIPSDSIHGEVIIRPLIRSADKVLERPNFRKYGDSAEYQIMTISSALRRHPSVLISMSFQDLNRQLINPLTFKKVEPSFIDHFFRDRP
jgi:hypothetical protein